MIIHDGKKAAGLILSKMKSDGGFEPPSPSPEGDDGEDLKAIAQDMFTAFEKKDTGLLVSALQAFMGCIKDEDEEQYQGE